CGSWIAGGATAGAATGSAAWGAGAGMPSAARFTTAPGAAAVGEPWNACGCAVALCALEGIGGACAWAAAWIAAAKPVGGAAGCAAAGAGSLPSDWGGREEPPSMILYSLLFLGAPAAAMSNAAAKPPWPGGVMGGFSRGLGFDVNTSNSSLAWMTFFSGSWCSASGTAAAGAGSAGFGLLTISYSSCVSCEAAG